MGMNGQVIKGERAGGLLSNFNHTRRAWLHQRALAVALPKPDSVPRQALIRMGNP
jgi:hypothetical protein